MKLPFLKPWESAIAVLQDNIFKQEFHTWNSSFSEVRGELAPAIPASLSLTTERRKDPRFSVSLPVYHRIKNNYSFWRKGESIDVSQNGIRLAVEDPVSIGTHIEMDIKLPHHKKLVRIKGVVVWAKPAFNRQAVYECGVAFESLRTISKKEKIIHFMADRLCRLALRETYRMVCRPAASKDDLCAAYRLVYEEYLRRGYCKPDPSRLHYTAYCFFPDSRTFVLELDGKIVGTVSLIVDSACGLPMEHLFGPEVQKLKHPDKRFAEVGLLALDQKIFGRKSFSLTDFKKLSGTFRLFKLLFDYARFAAGVSDILIIMHPKHEDLYRYLTFETIGPVRQYGAAEGNPALPMHLDIDRSLATTSQTLGIWRYFVEEALPQALIYSGLHGDPQTLQEFLFELKPLWPGLEPEFKECLKEFYPQLRNL